MYRDIVVPKILKPFHCNQLIRLGKDNDGGYLVNKHDVEKSLSLISFGIGTDCSFEKNFSKINDIKVLSFDKDADVNLDREFYSGHRNICYKYVDNFSSEDTMSFKEIVWEQSNNIFLKCDIEGKEYDLLDEIIQNDTRFSGMVIEFHGLSNHKNFDNLANFIGKIRHKLVHIHPNNHIFSFDSFIPDVLELTFTSSDNIEYNPNISLPHSLDMTNCVGAYDYRLIFQT